MQVLVVSSSYPSTAEDWRGRFIADMVAALPSENVSVRLWAPPGPVSADVTVATTEADREWLDKLAEAGGIASRLRAGPVAAVSSSLGLLLRLRQAYRRERADVLHVNWLQNALPLWGTPHPAVVGVLGADFGLLRLPGMAALLRTVLARRRVILAPNAPWMAPHLTSLFGDVATIKPLPFGVASDWYLIERRPAVNRAPWLAVTRITRAKLGELVQWGAGLFDQNRPLVLLGPMQENLSLPSWIDYRGPTYPKALRCEWFPQAAGLVTLSRHDEGRPQVMIEAMAAGLPIIATALPAHRDLILDGGNGWLTESREALSEALDDLTNPQRNRAAGKESRDKALREIGDWKTAAERFRAAYREVCTS